MPLFKRNKDEFIVHSRRAIDENGFFVSQKYVTKKFDEFERTFKKSCLEMIRKKAADRFTLNYMNDKIDAVLESELADLKRQRQEHQQLIRFQEAWASGDDVEYNIRIDNIENELKKISRDIDMYEREYRIQNGFWFEDKPEDEDYGEYDEDDDID